MIHGERKGNDNEVAGESLHGVWEEWEKVKNLRGIRILCHVH